MTRTTKALQRFGIVGLSATLLIGSPFAIQSASAAGTSLLTAADCTQPSSGTTTTTVPNTNGAVTPANPSNATGAGSGCTTQAQINTAATLTFTYTEGGAAVPGRTLDFTLPQAAPPSGNFPAAQPGNTTSFAGPNPSNYPGQGAQCTTDGLGQCKVNITDSKAEPITVNAVERASGAMAFELIDFRTFSVAPVRLDDQVDGTVSPDRGAEASPGRPVQHTYTLTDTNGGDCNNGLPAGTASNAGTCTGTTLASVKVTLSLPNSAAFFTKNCQLNDSYGAPQRTYTAATMTAPSTGTLDSPNYKGCGFTPAPADKQMVSPLVNQGQSLDVVTDQYGQFTVTIAEGRDLGFDAQGLVNVNLTATAGTTALTPRNYGSGLANRSTCPGAYFGCTASPTVFSTRGYALNGSSVSFVPVDGHTFAAGVNNVPTVQSRIFVLHVMDQYGNLTLARPLPLDATVEGGVSQLSLVKSGHGDLRYCGTGNSTTQDPCPYRSGGTDVTANDGTTTTTFSQPRGSFTDRAFQERFISENNNDPGTQTLKATWIAPRTDFMFSAAVAGPPAVPAALNGFDQTRTDNIQTATVTLNWYLQTPNNITFTSTPAGGSAIAGSVISVTATVLDQFNQPVPDATANFFRSGTSNNCSATASNGTGPNGAITTNPATGKAGFSFSCQDPSTQNVTIIVADGNGVELGRGLVTVTFTGGTPAQTGPVSFRPDVPVILAGQHTALHVFGPMGDNIQVFELRAGAATYRPLGTVHIVSGEALFGVSPEVNTHYYVVDAHGASAPDVIYVKARQSIEVTVFGTTVYFTGVIAPNFNDRSVTVFYFDAMGRHVAGSSFTYHYAGRDGYYRVSIVLPAHHSYTAYAYTATDFRGYAGHSEVKSFTTGG